MTEQEFRLANPYQNNFCASIPGSFPITVASGSPYGSIGGGAPTGELCPRDRGRLKGCGQQAGYVEVMLQENLISYLQDDWQIDAQNGFTPLPHQWLRLTSTGANDPAIRLDPWNWTVVFE